MFLLTFLKFKLSSIIGFRFQQKIKIDFVKKYNFSQRFQKLLGILNFDFFNGPITFLLLQKLKNRHHCKTNKLIRFPQNIKLKI